MAKYILFILFVFYVGSQAQSGEKFFSFLPDYYLYNPNPANLNEAKIGFDYTHKDNKIYLNIGASRDIFHLGSCECNKFAFGTEFFTWTLLRGEPEFKFPVMAVDYYFGLYLSNRFSAFGTYWSNRIRFAHISSHLADGSWNDMDSLWIDNLNPFVYSREFLEFNSTIDLSFIKPYFGFTYIYHVKPKTTGSFVFNLGTEFELIKYSNMSLYSAVDLKFYKQYEEKLENDLNFQIGIKFGEPYKSNIRFYFDYYKGTNLNGPYSFQRMEKSLFGFSLFI